MRFKIKKLIVSLFEMKGKEGLELVTLRCGLFIK